MGTSTAVISSLVVVILLTHQESLMVENDETKNSGVTVLKIGFQEGRGQDHPFQVDLPSQRSW